MNEPGTSRIRRGAHPSLRLGLTLVWFCAVCFLLFLPSDAPVIDPLLSGTNDLVDALGHMALFTVFGVLCRWASLSMMSRAEANRSVILFGVLLGSMAETLQNFVPARGVTLLDAGANALGCVVAVVVMEYLERRREPGGIQ